MLPAVVSHIRDAYIASSSLLKVAVFGLIATANLPESADLSKGEFMRFCMEAPWYPANLLPSQGVIWQAVDAQSADAFFTDAGRTISLRLGFGADGLISTVLAADPARLISETNNSDAMAGSLFKLR